jgi:hypothetical protein
VRRHSTSASGNEGGEIAFAIAFAPRAQNRYFWYRADDYYSKSVKTMCPSLSENMRGGLSYESKNLSYVERKHSDDDNLNFVALNTCFIENSHLILFFRNFRGRKIYVGPNSVNMPYPLGQPEGSD